MRLVLGCAVTLFVASAILTLLAVTQAPSRRDLPRGRNASAGASADSTPAETPDGSFHDGRAAPRWSEATRAIAQGGGGAASSSISSHSGAARPIAANGSISAALSVSAGGAAGGAGARLCATTTEAKAALALHARGVGRRRVLAAVLHSLSALLVLTSLPLPALDVSLELQMRPAALDEVAVLAGDMATDGTRGVAAFMSALRAALSSTAARSLSSASPSSPSAKTTITISRRSISLLDAAAGAVGTRVDPSALVLLHGNWVQAMGSVASSGRPPHT